MKAYRIDLLLLLIGVFSFFSVSAQTPDSSGVYSIAATMPAYQGGEEAMYAFINKNVNYPQDALTEKKSGTVQLRVVVNEDGRVTNARVMRGVCASLDSEAIRVVQSTSGNWTSGKMEDRPVKTYKYMRVRFTIDTTTSKPAELSIPVQPLRFIGGDTAFYTFIKKYIKVPNTVLIHPEMMVPVTVSVSFTTLNQISDVVVLKGSYPTLNEEAVRLIRLSQGKWIRSDVNYPTGEANIMITLPFGKSMIDSAAYKNLLPEDIITVAIRTNPVFARAYENYQNRSYEVAIVDLNECINKNKNHDAAMAIRAYCYLNMENFGAACQDLVSLRSVKGMDSNVEEMYFKYCSDPKTLIQRHASPGFH